MSRVSHLHFWYQRNTYRFLVCISLHNHEQCISTRKFVKRVSTYFDTWTRYSSCLLINPNNVLTDYWLKRSHILQAIHEISEETIGTGASITVWFPFRCSKTPVVDETYPRYCTNFYMQALRTNAMSFSLILSIITACFSFVRQKTRMSSMWTLTAAFTRSSPRISIGAAPLRDILEMPQATSGACDSEASFCM